MNVNELWNTLSGYGLHEQVQIDATGLKIGRDHHIEVPISSNLLHELQGGRLSDGLASEGLRADL